MEMEREAAVIDFPLIANSSPENGCFGRISGVKLFEMSGLVTYQQLALIEGDITPKFKPQMIIVLDGHNDCPRNTAQITPRIG